MHGFNRYCALLFFKAALLKGDEGFLIQQTENGQAAHEDGEALTSIIFLSQCNPRAGGQGWKNTYRKFSMAND
jgi:hypothetical protein